MNEATAAVSDTQSPPTKGHLIPAILVLGLSLVVAWLSFTREPAGAFLFPRLISAVMLLLASWNFIRAAKGASKVGGGIAKSTWQRILPGLILMALFVFYAAKAFGFYVASTSAFFLLYAIYDPAPHAALSSWIKRIAVTFFFMGIVYALFALLLKVQTPRGLFF